MKEFCARPGQIIVLGRQGEHLARCITFDIADWEATYGQGTVQLLVQRSRYESPYPCVVSAGDGVAKWKVRAVDVAVPGHGRIEMQYHVGGAVVKSETYRTLVMEALGEPGAMPPDPEKDWVEVVLQAARDAEQSAQEAREGIKQTITMGANGNWFIGDRDTGVSAVGPRGEKGDSGLPHVVSLAGAVLETVLVNNVDYRCADVVTDLTVTGFSADPDGRSEAWSIRFIADAGITVNLPEYVAWNYGATPVFTPGSEYHLMFAPLLNGKVLCVWNEVEA